MSNPKVIGVNFGSITDDEEDVAENRSKVDAEEVLKAVRSLGAEFLADAKAYLDPGAGTADKQHYRDILKVQKMAKSYLMSESDKKMAFWRLFESVYDGLSQDSWSGELFLKRDKNPITEAELLSYLENALVSSSPLSEPMFERRLKVHLKWRQFNPVQKYLEGLGKKLNPDDPYDDEAIANWEPGKSLAKTLFGSDDPLDQIKLTKWLVGAVARAMKPGCQMDSALVITGSQGTGKTSVLKALFGEWFTTLLSDKSTIDQQRQIQKSWGCELGEIESTFSIKDISHLKAFLTEREDDYRDHHENLTRKRPRHCVFAGTTNQATFLTDPTGSRRFWVIDSGDFQIPVKWVEKNRDRIWGWAYSLYKSDRQWHLTPEEMAMDKEASKVYQTESQFQEPLQKALDAIEKEKGAIAIQASEVMTHLLNIPVERQNQKVKKEVASVLKNLGYVRISKYFNGKSSYFYIKPESQDPNRFNTDMMVAIDRAEKYSKFTD